MYTFRYLVHTSHTPRKNLLSVKSTFRPEEAIPERNSTSQRVLFMFSLRSAGGGNFTDRRFFPVSLSNVGDVSACLST